MTLKPAIVSLQSAKQMHGPIKNELGTQTNQRRVELVHAVIFVSREGQAFEQPLRSEHWYAGSVS